MRTLFYAFVLTVLTSSFMSCSKDSLTDDQKVHEVASEGDEQKKPDEKPGY